MLPLSNPLIPRRFDRSPAGHLPDHRFATSRATACLLATLLGGLLIPEAAAGQSGTLKARAPGAPSSAIQSFQSKSFQVVTDLSADEARELLGRLESMLGLISNYWGRPHRGVIEMYVVKDLSRWPAAQLRGMAPDGLISIQSGGGLTKGTVVSRGREFRSKAVVYATADRGTPQHEAVHAYCVHAFGKTGPVWYAEGMAEVGQYWRADDKSVQIHPEVLRYLRDAPRKSIRDIVDSPLEATGDSWQNYAWRWVLCHLLGHNENYTARFKPLGMALLTKNDTSFAKVYGSQAQEIQFEYNLFLDNLEQGYRVDLCSWDWKTPFRPPRGDNSLLSQIDAGRGWQASRLRAVKGTEYEYVASGEWQTSQAGEPVDADGDANGRARLAGVLLADETLTEPFELGTAGTWTAPADGNLYLRCRDAWGEIADNRGTLSVRLKIAGVGRPLTAPAPDAERGSAPPKPAADSDAR